MFKHTWFRYPDGLRSEGDTTARGSAVGHISALQISARAGDPGGGPGHPKAYELPFISYIMVRCATLPHLCTYSAATVLTSTLIDP